MLMEQERKNQTKRNSRAAQEASRLRAERARREEEEKRKAKQEKQRRKQERKERNSRAAQTVQQQKKERKEDHRLDDLRQKQKRDAKQRTKRRISPVVWKRLMIMGGVILAVVLTMVIFFRIASIEVFGNTYYSAQEIREVCGVHEGDNLLFLSRGEIAGNIMANLRYVESVRVTRDLPDRVILTVTEFPATYAVLDQGGNYYLITAEGEAVEAVDAGEAAKHILVEEITINTPVIGDAVEVETGSTGAQARKQAMLDLLQALEAADLVKMVRSVQIPSAGALSLEYQDRFTVTLGNAERLDYKLEFLKEVISRQKDYATGSIDLSFAEGESAVVKLDE